MHFLYTVPIILRVSKLEKREWPGPLNPHINPGQVPGTSSPSALLAHKLRLKAPAWNPPQFSLHNGICLMIEKEILNLFPPKKMSIREKEERVTSWVMGDWISWSNRIILHSCCTLLFLRYFWMNLNNLKITWGVEHITLILKIRKILKEVKRLT